LYIYGRPDLRLRILEDNGLVESPKDGLGVDYRLADGKGSPYAWYHAR
jgi:hypothetical protein